MKSEANKMIQLKNFNLHTCSTVALFVLCSGALYGCALITTPIKVIGSAAKTTIKAGGAAVSGTASAVGNIGSDKDNDDGDEK